MHGHDYTVYNHQIAQRTQARVEGVHWNGRAPEVSETHAEEYINIRWLHLSWQHQQLSNHKIFAGRSNDISGVSNWSTHAPCPSARNTFHQPIITHQDLQKQIRARAKCTSVPVHFYGARLIKQALSQANYVLNHMHKSNGPNILRSQAINFEHGFSFASLR